MSDIDTKLTEVRDWAQAKLDANQEPPWAWKSYQQLIDSLDAVIAGREATVPLECSQQLAELLESALPQSGSVYPLDNARLRRGKADLQLPM